MALQFDDLIYAKPDSTQVVNLSYNHPQFGWIPYTYVKGMTDAPEGMAEFVAKATVAKFEAPDIDVDKLTAWLDDQYEAEVSDNNLTIDAHGTKFQAGTRTKDFLTKLIALYNVSGVVGPHQTFTDYYNVRHPYDSIDYLVTIATKIAERDSAMYTKLQDLKAAARSATTQEALKSLTWD